MVYPKMMRIRQKFDAPILEDAQGAARDELEKLDLSSDGSARIKQGQTVAITAGSRGIASIDVIIKTIISELQELGAKPFIVPAMGSHGGGTAEGQRRIVESYGMSEEAMGAPIKSSMEVVQIGATEYGMPVYLDKQASEADHIVVVNRVKLHTRFTGRVESGLMKMMMIGLGKHEGAKTYHRAVESLGFPRIVETVGDIVLKSAPIAFGVAIIENAYDQTAKVAAVRPQDFMKVEPALLEESKRLMPKLPFNKVDVLIVDEMGKDISGTGMDTNIIGRKENLRGDVAIKRIFVRDLTEKTHGSAVGIGAADFTTQRLRDKMDYKATCINCLTALRPEGAKLPITFDTDQECIDAAISSAGFVVPENAGIIHIKNTLELGETWVSEKYLDDVKERGDLEIVSQPTDMEFDHEGNLANI